MPTFTFNARDVRGQWHKGSSAADNPAALAGTLRARGLFLINARPSDDDEPVTPRRRGILPPASLDIELGLRMLSSMLDGGLTLMAALKTCAQQARRPSMARIWDDVHDRIAGGMSFADAMTRHERCFSKLVIQLVRAGELSGNMEVVLTQAAEQLERKRNLLVTLYSALMYPAFTTLVAVGVTAYLMIKVIPEIAQFLTSSGKKLPAITLNLIATSDFIRGNILIILFILFAAVVGVIVAYRFPVAAKTMDRWLLRVPVVGKLLRLSGTTMFSRGLGMLLEAGVPVVEALETSGSLIKNRAISDRVETARRSVLAGNALARPLAAGGEFMPMLPRMVAVGEETGTLSSVLTKLANFHEQQLQSYIKRMTLLIEPVMTVVVGVIVGFVYLAFFMAIYSF